MSKSSLRVDFLKSLYVVVALSTSAFSVSARSAENEQKYLHRFPDSNLKHIPPKTEYDEPLFQLSQQYPETLPEIDSEVQKILAIPFDENSEKENWREYLLAVRDYCLDGNVEVDWRGQNNEVRKWYHVPWQHMGEKGREGIHGLTREATAKPRQFAPTQLKRHQTHAVALYNDLGGWTIGEVWRDQFQPDPTKSTFPVGTVVVKILFTQADEQEVPFLANPITWKAYVQDPADQRPQAERSRIVQDLRLLQMDVMVRDARADKTGGWVFGTYCYNGALNRRDPWTNLVPVGIQWGNDPGVLDPSDNFTNPEATWTFYSEALKETIINLDTKELPPQHLGWGGRLNGPADYYRSSCMSCHSTAQYPVLEPQHPDFEEHRRIAEGTAEWNAWFRNLPVGESFSPIVRGDVKRAMSTDNSLQLAIGIDNFYRWKSQLMDGHFELAMPGARSTERLETYRPTSEPKDR